MDWMLLAIAAGVGAAMGALITWTLAQQRHNAAQTQKAAQWQTQWQAEKHDLLTQHQAEQTALTQQWQTEKHDLATQLAQLTERERLTASALTQAQQEARTLEQTLRQERRELEQTLRQQLDTVQAQLAQATTAAELLRQERDTLQAQLTDFTVHEKAQREKDFQSFLQKTLDTSREKLQEQTDRLRREGQETFGEQMKTLVNPLETMVKEYERKLADLNEKHLSRFEQVDQRVVDLTRAKDELVGVLKLNKGAGTWGELQLTRLLEFAGLQEKIHFDLQVHIATADGRASRPDVRINFPQKGHVYVDAKTLQLTQTQDPALATPDGLEGIVGDENLPWEEKARRLNKSLLTAAKDLGSKNYPALEPDSANFVILFVPQESMLSLACQINPNIVEQALAHNVLLATPLNLVAMLRIIHFGWQQYSLSEQIQDIRKLGADLHGQLGLFTERMLEVEVSLDGAQKAFGSAMTAFQGKTGLVLRLNRLAEYGCSSGKRFKNTQKLAQTLTNEDTLNDLAGLPGEVAELAEVGG